MGGSFFASRREIQSSSTGGRAYQVLAAGLTYLAIVSTYIPVIIQEMARNPSVGGFFLGLGALVLLAAALPFLAGIENILGIVIIAVGLFEAWRINKRLVLAVAGPFEIGRPAALQPASGPAA